MTIAILKVAASILPIIAKVVESVEEVHSHYNGDKKKQMALELVETLYNGTEPVIPYATLAPHIGGAIDKLVQKYNENGDFVQSPVTAVA